MSTYRQIQEIFNQLIHVLVNSEGYCEKSKAYALFMNLLCKAMSIRHGVNNNDNFVKFYTSSLLDIFQSKNGVLVEKNVNNILETFI